MAHTADGPDIHSSQLRDVLLQLQACEGRGDIQPPLQSVQDGSGELGAQATSKLPQALHSQD